MTLLSIATDPLTTWYQTPHGEAARIYGLRLLQHMLTPWPRRAQTMLIMGCGSGHILPYLWEAGFDITGIDPEQATVQRLRERLGDRLCLEVASPEHLSYGDNSFDFVVLPPLRKGRAAVEDVLCEAVRVSAKGVLLAFWNPHSLAGWGRCAACSPLAPLRQTFWWLPYRWYARQLRVHAPQGRVWGRTILYTPPSLWTRPWADVANGTMSAVPLGALGILGLQHATGTPLTGTPLRLKTLGMMGRPPEAALECRSNAPQRTE